MTRADDQALGGHMDQVRELSAILDFSWQSRLPHVSGNPRALDPTQ